MKEKIIVSLTTYPARIQTVNQVIECLLAQTIKPDKIVLWLSYEEFPNRENDLPEQLLKLERENDIFEIDWCHNIRSYKKLIPTLRKYPNDIIITADDDILYEPCRVENLYKTWQKHKNNIIAHRVHYIVKKDNKIEPYLKWLHCITKTAPSFNLFLTGAGMVLYFPNCFYEDILKEELFTKLSPTADDIWFWAMSTLKGTKIRIAKSCITDLTYIDGTPESGLYHINCNENKNDLYMKQMLDYYPTLIQKINSKKPFIISKINKKWYQQILSVKNEFNHKVWTILGLKIKFKRKNKTPQRERERERERESSFSNGI